ncbi:MAG TPA: isochorismatase family protein [Spirochaetota bacterium]
MKKISALLIGIGFCSAHLSAQDNTIIEKWNQIKVPHAVTPVAVKINPDTTALLILDIEQRTVPSRPRAVAAVPKIKKILEWARSHNVLVAYSITTLSSPDAILPDVKPIHDEHVVKASVDKYFGTDLEKYLKDRNISTVIITGTAAEGAVLGTMIGSVLRGFTVILPVDGIPSSEPYAEQYVVWHALNAPGTRGKVIVTKGNMISAETN